MKKLVSEQLPNDGGYHIKRLVNEANERLKQIGKHGKRAKIVAKKGSLSLQFTFEDEEGKKQRNKGLGGIPCSANGILEAEGKAQMVTNQLTANQFTWDWFNSLIGKDASEQSKQLTCREMVELYKKHFFQQRKGNKYPEKSWYERCRRLEKIAKNSEKLLSLALVRKVIESTENNTQNREITINGLVEFLRYFDNSDYKKAIREYKKNNNSKRKKRNVPCDKRISEVYQTGFFPCATNSKKYGHRYPQWQFLFGLLATYGLRIHEVWSIANWDKPVILKGDDWVTVDLDEDKTIEFKRSGGDLIIPAILDPDNKNYILCIKHDTKTGYRMVMPLSPEGHNWLEEFNLLEDFKLPYIENPLEKAGKGLGSYRCADKTTKWFYKKGYGFTPHDLRHAYNHRGHQLGINPKALADSLGHSMTINTTAYLRHMSHEVRHKGLIESMNKEQNKRSENELLKEEVKELETQLEAKDNKIRMLEAEIKMYEAIKESKGNS